MKMLMENVATQLQLGRESLREIQSQELFDKVGSDSRNTVQAGSSGQEAV